MSDDGNVTDPDEETGDEKAPLAPEVEWAPNFPLARQIDSYWSLGEKWLCGLMFLAMSVMVFASVLTSVFANRREWIDVAILFVFAYLAVRTRAVKDGEQRLSQVASLLWAGGSTAAITGAVYWYLERYPSGLEAAKGLSVCLMLWVALLGASITTWDRSHLALEFGEKIWPQKFLHLVKAFARALTALCCGFLLWLSCIAVANSYSTWEKSDHFGGLVDELDWMPVWVVLLVLPYTFGAMAIRFLAQGYTVGTHQSKPEDEQMPT